MGVLFGLGCGRCGTKSLSRLLNAQPATVCFHEMNPSAMAWQGAGDTVLSLLRDFSAILAGEVRAVTVDRNSPNRDYASDRLHELDRITHIGDVASYYLPYVERILEFDPSAKFPCLKRDRDEVIDSYRRHLVVNGRPSKPLLARIKRGIFGPLPVRYQNRWASRASSKWVSNTKWDKCFPKFDDDYEDIESYIKLFYDYYYEKVYYLQKIYKDNISVFDISALNTDSGRAEILNFCGIERANYAIEVHENAGRRDAPGPASPARPRSRHG